MELIGQSAKSQHAVARRTAKPFCRLKVAVFIDLTALFRYDANHSSIHFPFIFNDFHGSVSGREEVFHAGCAAGRKRGTGTCHRRGDHALRPETATLFLHEDEQPRDCLPVGKIPLRPLRESVRHHGLRERERRRVRLHRTGRPAEPGHRRRARGRRNSRRGPDKEARQARNIEILHEGSRQEIRHRRKPALRNLYVARRDQGLPGRHFRAS